ncbi:MAG: hypothetical protein D3909_13110 [Candidatus Electrothrix sp. ATG1]|nr:hypothetical protein [Candidatus Electrothrix sp. ATG1]
MSVRLGKITLAAVQHISIEEGRVAGRKSGADTFSASLPGSGGLTPTVLVMEGLLFGPEYLAELKELRRVWIAGEPLAFAADIAVGSELTEVVIEELRVEQMAGYVERVQFWMRLREYEEPLGDAVTSVDAGVRADAEGWMKERVAKYEVGAAF